MSDELRFQDDSEARAWDALYAAIVGAMAREAIHNDYAPGEFAASCGQTADTLLLERRKRTAPQAQGEDGLPEGWHRVFDSPQGADHYALTGTGYTVYRYDGQSKWYAFLGHVTIDKSRRRDFAYPTRAATIAAVEAHLRGGEHPA